MLSSIPLISGPSDEPLAREVARSLGTPFYPAELKVFSDGESKIRIPEKVGNACVIVQSTGPPTDTNLMRLLMMATKCYNDGCRDICAVVPYLGYARQDREFLEGEVATIFLISKLMGTVGIRQLITVDIHSARAVSAFKIGVTNVSAIPLLAKYATMMGVYDPVVISPDVGGKARAEQFANILNCDSDFLKKTRNRETGEVIIDEEDLRIELRGRDCVLVDDIISSGTSIVKASNLVHKKGAANVVVFCTHALLIDGAADRIKAAGVREIIATNSIAGAFSKVDLSNTIADSIRAHFTRLA